MLSYFSAFSLAYLYFGVMSKKPRQVQRHEALMFSRRFLKSMCICSGQAVPGLSCSPRRRPSLAQAGSSLGQAPEPLGAAVGSSSLTKGQT